MKSKRNVQLKKIQSVKLMTAILLSLAGFGVKSATDARIKRIAYQENQVYQLYGVTFTATQVVFGEDEVILTKEGGDRAVWMVTNPLPNMAFIKPTTLGSNSNIIIVTNKHSYYFHAQSNSSLETNPASRTYAIKFSYPEEEARKRKEEALKKRQEQDMRIEPNLHPERYHWNYGFSGNKELAPLHVFDDGRFTYLEIAKNQPIPAVFAVDREGKEAVVNTRRVDNYLVIHRLSPQFSLRLGRLVTSVFNRDEILRIREGKRPQ